MDSGSLIADFSFMLLISLIILEKYTKAATVSREKFRWRGGLPKAEKGLDNLHGIIHLETHCYQPHLNW